MNEIQRLWDASLPWLHVLPSETDVAHIRTSAPTESALLVELNGARMRTVDDLFREFVREFRFPEYFGWNWPAYAECIGNLEWLPARSYLTIVRQPELLLDDSPADRETFYRITNNVCSRWANSFALGPEWGGGEVPFNIALFCDEPNREAVKQMVGAYL